MRLRAWSWWAALLLGAVGARELDPGACAPRFDVQRDKIIRTEESRDMGARYLSELDVGARAECLRLCCETDACDVFVYEEKVLCALSFLATGSYQRIVGVTQHLPQRTASRCIRQVVDALNHPAIMAKWIVFPKTRQDRAIIKQEFQRRFGLPGVIGCIDCTHVALVKPNDEEHLFYNRKGYHSLNVQMGPGSCYLFNCGPPEDFRCKFTAHSNFSSGVLAISRRLAELQDQERLAHHEQELTNLRSSGASSSTASTTTASTAPPPPPPAPPRPTPPRDNRPPTSRCSRYQFACRRGGECIAVYNACDGVAQCADGSDEAPELGCPPTPAPRVPSPPSPTPALLKPLQESVEAAGDAPGDGAALPDRWPHRLTQAQPQHRYNEGPASSHIFSHKGGLLQEPESGAQFPPFEPPWPRRAWAPPQPNGNGMEGMSAERGWGGAYWPEPDPRRAWPVPRTEQEIPVYIPPKTMPEIPVVYSSQQQTLRDSPKKGFEFMKKEPSAAPAPAAERAPGAGPREEKTVQTSKSAESADKKAVSAAAHVHYPAGEHGEHDEHDGLSEHPPAAMMLLVLGLFMLTAMMGMLTCRARAALRRRRGRKSALAHDADYLVNGMYL